MVGPVREHRHGPWVHSHRFSASHRHLGLPFRSASVDETPDQGRPAQHAHHDGVHGHVHAGGLIDPSIVRSRAGVRAVSISLAVLGVTAVMQGVVFWLSGSVALLADLIHNGGDALTAVPLGIAFLARSERAERRAGYAVVIAIFASAAVAAYEASDRLIHPQNLHYLGALALAGIIGFAGNELAARIRLRAGARLDSPALIADGQHARVDGFVSLGVVASAAVVTAGVRIADPAIGLAITVLILRITWQAGRTISAPRRRHEH